MEHLNVVVLGEVGIGKSSLIIRFAQSHFTEDHDPTLQDTYTGVVTLDSSELVSSMRSIDSNQDTYILDVLDTVGIEDYSDLRENQIKEADAVILCYDVTSKHSYDIVTILHQQVLRCREEDLPPMVLCGTRSDLVDSRQLSYHDGELLKEELELPLFLETSAKLNVNVDKCFTKIAEQILARRASQSHVETPVEPSPAPQTQDIHHVDSTSTLPEEDSNQRTSQHLAQDSHDLKLSNSKPDQPPQLVSSNHRNISKPAQQPSKNETKCCIIM